MANKKITIERLAALAQEQFLTLDKKMNGLQEDIKEGFHIVLEEMKGRRDDVKIAHRASCVEHAGVVERLEKLGADMKKVKENVKIEQ
jgi:hypothetical protein